MQCHAIRYWIRQAQHTHASNPDLLKDRTTKDKERKERRKGKKGKNKKEGKQLLRKNTNSKARPYETIEETIEGKTKYPGPEAKWGVRNEFVTPRRRCDRQNKNKNRRHHQEQARYPRLTIFIFIFHKKTEKRGKKTETQPNHIRSSRSSLQHEQHGHVLPTS